MMSVRPMFHVYSSFISSLLSIARSGISAIDGSSGFFGKIGMGSPEYGQWIETTVKE